MVALDLDTIREIRGKIRLVYAYKTEYELYGKLSNCRIEGIAGDETQDSYLNEICFFNCLDHIIGKENYKVTEGNEKDSEKYGYYMLFHPDELGFGALLFTTPYLKKLSKIYNDNNIDLKKDVYVGNVVSWMIFTNSDFEYDISDICIANDNMGIVITSTDFSFYVDIAIKGIQSIERYSKNMVNTFNKKGIVVAELLDGSVTITKPKGPKRRKRKWDNRGNYKKALIKKAYDRNVLIKR